MAMDTFIEAWNKVKELHEKEVIGLQTKLADLTMEKCRDAQRIEELFAKNHLLREHQRFLNENVKVLENRLRAGLCDRCTVTQELAKKKQQEFESTHFQSLQHISSLTNEINGLKDEKKSLLEELNMLKYPDDRVKAQAGRSPEDHSHSSSPLPLASPGAQKKNLERTPSRDTEGREEPSYSQPAEEKSGSSHSPGARTSPAVTTTPDGHLYEMNPQRIANQLHGTIAVVRPGSRSCQQEKISEGPTWAMGKVTTPNYRIDADSSPNYLNDTSMTTNHHNDTDRHSRESWEAASPYEMPKQGSREEHLYRLSHHLAMHRTGLHSPTIPVETISRFSSHVPKARDSEHGWRRSQEGWEERTPVVGRVVYLSEHDLRGRLSVFEPRERLQYFRARKQQQIQWAKVETQSNQATAQAYPNQQAMQAELIERAQCKASKNMELRPPEPAEWPERSPLLKSPKNPEPSEIVWTGNSCPPDKPLDLSDYGRGRDSHGPPEDGSPKQCQPETNLQSPVCKESSSPLETGSSPPNTLHNEGDKQGSHHSRPNATGMQFHRDSDSGQDDIKDGVDGVLTLDWKSSLQGHDTDSVASCTRDESSGMRLILSVRRQNPEPQRQPDDDDDDGGSTKRESDKVESSDSEVTDQYSTESTSQTCTEEVKYFCVKDKAQGTPKKRKRGHDPWTKAHRRFSKGRKKTKALQGQPAAEEMENSTSSSNNVLGGT